MRINQNIAAFNAYRNLNNTQNNLSGSLEKLSSGFRINRAADDASGLVNSENLRSQIGGLKVATRNAQDAISLVQTAEGAQTEVHSILQRMRDLVVQSGNVGTNDEASIKANNDELTQLKEELTRIADQTQFGTQKIFDGTFEKAAAVEAADEQPATEAEFAFEWAPGTATEVATWTVDLNGAELTTDIAGNADADTVASALGSLTGVSASNDDGTITVTADDVGAGSVAVSVEAITDGGAISNTDATDGTDLVEAVEAADAKEGATFQVGANSGQTVSVGINSVKADSLGQNATYVDAEGTTVTSIYGSIEEISLSTEEVNGEGLGGQVASALATIDEAIEGVSESRAELGAFQNRMESTIRNISVAVENLSAAESRIRDTDMAMEMVEFTRNQILSQAGTAMLAQANVIPQSVLSLLG